MKKNQHRGKFLYAKIKQQGFKIRAIIDKMGRARSSVYDDFKTPALEWELLLRYGRAMEYDFSNDFPELKQYMSTLPNDTAQLQKEIQHWKDEAYRNLKAADEWKTKYLLLLEKTK